MDFAVMGSLQELSMRNSVKVTLKVSKSLELDLHPMYFQETPMFLKCGKKETRLYSKLKLRKEELLLLKGVLNLER